MGKWTRRTLIGAGGLVGGGFALGVGGILLAPNRLSVQPDAKAGTSRLTTWLRIDRDGQIVATIPHCEMGQGAQNGLAMMLADELEADFSRLRIEEAPPEKVYANGYILRGFAEEGGLAVPAWLERALDYGTFKAADIAGLQITGGSSSIRSTGWYGMRVAGAAAKAMLIEAAAREWGVPAAECRARDSEVVHAASGSRSTFGALADAAARLEIPAHAPLKSRAEYRLVGTPVPREDIPMKVDGTARYAIDVSVPGLRYAAVRAAPVPGGRLEGFDRARAEAMPGVEAVVSLDDAVAVVASSWWLANRAVDALAARFSDGGHGDMDTEAFYAALRAALDEEGLTFAASPADFTAEYRVPYLAHATMEPMAATAQVAAGRCEVWAGTQDPLSARGVAAGAAEVGFDAVTMHNMPLGGGFGRRLPGAFDYIEQAVRIAKAVSPTPVKLIWSREEDMGHDYYRPAVVARLGARLDAGGRPTRWQSFFTGDPFLDALAAEPIYAAGETDIRARRPPEHLRTGSWRSVAWSQHGFFMESFVDELAHASGSDPLEYRRALLESRPRHRRVLERVAAMAGWGSPPAEGRARGVAIVEAFGTITAEVAEIGIDSRGRIRVHEVSAAVDCGLIVNPDQAAAQIEGGIVFGLSAALHQKITLEDGAVVERNFPDYEVLRLADTPRIRVELLETEGVIGGLGEPAVPPIAPAVANAVFALTGQRLRELPLRPAIRVEEPLV